MPASTLKLPGGRETGIPLFPVLILLFVPLLASFILGTMYWNHQVLRVPTAFLDQDNSAMSRQLLRVLAANEVFHLKASPTNLDDLQGLLQRGEVATAIVVPPHFSEELVHGKSPRVLVLYDATQMSMASATKTRIAEVLGTAKVAYLLQVMQGKLNVAPEAASAALLPFTSTTRYLGNPTKNMPNSILEGFLINIAQVAMAMLGVELVGGAGRYRVLRKRGLVAATAGYLSILLILLSQTLVFGVPFRGSWVAAVLLTVPFVVGTLNFGTLLRLAINGRETAIFICAMLSVTLILAGYTFPSFAMGEPFQHLDWWLPIGHYAGPMRDIALVGRDWTQVLPDAVWLLGFVALMQAGGYALFRYRVPRIREVQ